VILLRNNFIFSGLLDGAMKGKRFFPLTVEERVLLHLKDHSFNENSFDAPHEVTQHGIAEGIGIQRKHVPRAMVGLMDQELVTERKCHVKGGKQRRKAYFLTIEGAERSATLWNGLRTRTVTVRTKDGDDTIRVEDIKRSFDISPLSVMLAADDDGVVDIMEAREFGHEIEHEHEDAHSLAEIYKIALKRAWFDGNITYDEFAILKDLRTKLGITEQVHSRIELEVITEVSRDNETSTDARKVYRVALERALYDGVITDDEKAILGDLSTVLGIGEDECRLLHREVEEELTGRKKPDATVDKHQVYINVLEQALADGIITEDENAMLERLRESLEITETEHMNMLLLIRKRSLE